MTETKVSKSVAEIMEKDGPLEGAFDDAQAEEEADVSEEPSAYTKAEQAHYHAIVSKERQVGILAGEWEEEKLAASKAKKRYENALDELRETIRGGAEQPMLPGMDEPAEAAEPGEGPAGWRDLPLSAAWIDGALEKALVSANLETLGQVADWEEVHTETLATLPGITEAMVSERSGLMAEFWETHPEFSETAEAPETEEGETATEESEGDDDA